MELMMDRDEADLLARILRQYLSELRSEVCRTDSYGMRQDLKLDEVRVKALIARLEQSMAVAA